MPFKKEYLFELVEAGYKSQTEYGLMVTKTIKRFRNIGQAEIADALQEVQYNNQKATIGNHRNNIHQLITMKDSTEYKLQSHLEIWEQDGIKYVTGFTTSGQGVFLKVDDIKTMGIAKGK